MNRIDLELNFQQLLENKFFAPLLNHPPLVRPRLFSLLNEGITRKLTVISAPAGFGKTTLLANWVTTLPMDDVYVAWLSLDREDNRPTQLWDYVLSALERVRSGIGEDSLSLLHAPQSLPFEQILIPLINALNNLDTILVLILDDYNVIDEPTIHKSLEFLIDHLPVKAHMILTTRAEPPLPLARWRAKDELVEIQSRYLRCTLEETALFLDKVMHLELPERIIQEMHLRTEGWLVGLQLLGLTLKYQPDPAIILDEKSGTNRFIVDYLIEEVLRQQPEPVQSFLLRTSILNRFTASLCEAVTGQTDCQAMLDYLVRENLFLFTLDEKHRRYRYHALFAEALGYQLEQIGRQRIPSLHRRAAQWYFDQENYLEATHHALKAENWELAVSGIESVATNTACGILAGQGVLAAFDGDAQKAQELVQQASPLILDEDYFNQVPRVIALSRAAYADGNFRLAYRYALEASDVYQAADNTAFAIVHKANAGYFLILEGRLRQASQVLQEAIQLGSEPNQPPYSAVGLAFVYQAELQREWNQLEDALENCLKGLSLAEQGGYRLYLEDAYLILARIHMALGNWDEAEAAFKEAEQLPEVAENPVYRAQLTSVDRVRLWLAQGDLDQARTWADGSGLNGDLLPKSAFARERVELACIRAWLAAGKLEKAGEKLSTLLDIARQVNRPRLSIECTLLQSLFYFKQHRQAEMLKLAAEMVDLAEEEGYLRIFLDEGNPAKQALSRLKKKNARPHPYLDSLLTAFQSGARFASRQPAPQHTHPALEQYLIEPLTPREMDVLRCLARGVSNQEIAQQLFISIDTVKRHITNIFKKLGVSNRTQAVLLARKQDLLDDDS